MLADARAPAFLTHAPYPLVLADARPPAFRTLVFPPLVPADAAPTAFLTPAASPLVLTDALLHRHAPAPFVLRQLLLLFALARPAKDFLCRRSLLLVDACISFHSRQLEDLALLHRLFAPFTLSMGHASFFTNKHPLHLAHASKVSLHVVTRPRVERVALHPMC